MGFKSDKYESVPEENYISNNIQKVSESGINRIQSTVSSVKLLNLDPEIEDDEGRASTRNSISYK